MPLIIPLARSRFMNRWTRVHFRRSAWFNRAHQRVIKSPAVEAHKCVLNIYRRQPNQQSTLQLFSWFNSVRSCGNTAFGDQFKAIRGSTDCNQGLWRRSTAVAVGYASLLTHEPSMSFRRWMRQRMPFGCLKARMFTQRWYVAIIIILVQWLHFWHSVSQECKQGRTVDSNI